MPLPAPLPLERGDVLTRPHYRTGDVIAVFDREAMLWQRHALVARIAIREFHDTTAKRQALADMSKAGPGDPNHYHGELIRDGAAVEPMRVILRTDSEDIDVRQDGGLPIPDFPANPLYMLEQRADQPSE